MNKLRLFIGVGICGILFIGCGFESVFHIGKVEIAEQVEKTKDCIPTDLKDRISNRRHYKYAVNEELNKNFETAYKHYKAIFSDMSNEGKSKCYDLVIESYNEAIKKAKKLPTSIDEERAFEKEWNVCDKMPEWLETKLNSYVSQNEAGASNLKQNWQDWFSRKALYVNTQKCIATKKATQAIENDLIDLGGGKKAKCADLSYKDAKKCLALFEKIYKANRAPLEGCTPSDLKDRLWSYSNSAIGYSKYYDELFQWDKNRTETICNEFMLNSYNEVIKQTKQLPTSIAEEKELHNKWAYCDIMPKWLEPKLNEYIEQNKNDDKAYIEASKFKEVWQEKLGGGHSTYNVNVLNKSGIHIFAVREHIKRITDCFATKAATKAIENDLIDLGNGKKAKCADLSWNDAQKCLDYFNSVYDKTYKVKEKEVIKKIDAINLKIERKQYKKQNKK